MEILQKDNDKSGKFYIEVDGKQVAEMVYTYRGKGKISIDHTGVDESLEGQGVGHKLLKEAVAFVRENKLKVIPLCPFVSAVFRRKPEEYKDIIA